MRVGDKPFRKVVFLLEPDAWHGYATESLWAEKVGDNRYRLKNSPFYAKDVSLEDVVFAEPDSEDRLLVSGVSLRAGHSTYRVVPKLSLEDEAFKQRWAPLQALRCSFEGNDSKLLAIDVPPNVDIHQIYDLLQQGEDAGVWEFEEGHCGHPLDGGGVTRETT